MVYAIGKRVSAKRMASSLALTLESSRICVPLRKRRMYIDEKHAYFDNANAADRVPPSRRTFFASTTDHTTLLQTSEIHCLSKENSKKQYVLAAKGMDTEKVKSIPYLHLGRIWLDSDGKTIYGAKVVNKTLGDIKDVCGRLLDAAIQDAGDGAKGLSTLHGLSEWVEGCVKNDLDFDDDNTGTKMVKDLIIGLNDSERKAVMSIINGDTSADVYDRGKSVWEILAREYVSQGLGKEAVLYQSKGGVLHQIEHLVDNTEYANTSGGAMAIFSLQ